MDAHVAQITYNYLVTIFTRELKANITLNIGFHIILHNSDLLVGVDGIKLTIVVKADP